YPCGRIVGREAQEVLGVELIRELEFSAPRVRVELIIGRLIARPAQAAEVAEQSVHIAGAGRICTADEPVGIERVSEETRIGIAADVLRVLRLENPDIVQLAVLEAGLDTNCRI